MPVARPLQTRLRTAPAATPAQSTPPRRHDCSHRRGFFGRPRRNAALATAVAGAAAVTTAIWCWGIAARRLPYRIYHRHFYHDYDHYYHYSTTIIINPQLPLLPLLPVRPPLLPARDFAALTARAADASAAAPALSRRCAAARRH